MSTKSRAPNGLKASGKALWAAVVGPYELEMHEELLLKEACRVADRLDRLHAEADAAPVTVINSKGDRTAHPALTEARQQEIVLARLLAALRLPQGDESEASGGLGRPQRRGAPRGVYGVRGVV
jgi:hypothetical protein